MVHMNERVVVWAMLMVWDERNLKIDMIEMRINIYIDR